MNSFPQNITSNEKRPIFFRGKRRNNYSMDLLMLHQRTRDIHPLYDD